MFTHVKLLGVAVNPLSISDLNLLISQSVINRKRWIIANHNLHSVYLYHHDPRVRDFFKIADYIHIDGMALVLTGQLLGLPLKREQRVTYVDWTPALMLEASLKKWRIFYLGSRPGVAEEGAAILRKQFPNLEIVTAHGYFDARLDSAENQTLLNAINDYQPHILMVGMGMPRQEHWILENFEHLNASVILPCGAMIDYVAGAIPTPPRWAGRCGLEWFFRLIAEPKRLWRRYLVEPLFLSRLLVADLLKKL